MTTSDASDVGHVQEFGLPDLGEGLEEATVTEWAVAEGDAVALNDPLCTVETAKAEVEIPSPHAGVIVERRGEPGETLTVGSLLVRIDTGDRASPAPDTASTTPDEQAPPRQAVLVGYGAEDDANDSRRRRKPARSSRPRAKPPVRKLARDLGVNLDELAPGSGRDGVITRDDVTRAARVQTEPAGTASHRHHSVDDSSAVTTPLTGVRARMAEKMAAARQHIPDAHASVTADFTRLLQVRAQLQEAADADTATTLTPLAVLLRLLVSALHAHPVINSTFVENPPAVSTFDVVHLGVGVATEHGLLVGVARNAHTLSTQQLAAEVARLSAGARAGALTPTELTGSTFTVSNFGALGLDEGVPVINYPEAAILGVGSIAHRPVVRDGQLTARPTATLTCAFDHRVCDGAQAASFLTHLRGLVETPERALLRL